MSQILLIAREASMLAELHAAFAPLGHQIDTCDNVTESMSMAANVVVVDTDQGCTEGRRVRAHFTSADATRVVWTGRGVSSGLGLVFAEQPDAVLPSPITMAGAVAALARLERIQRNSVASALDLASVDGPVEQYPPVRVLWTAHRTRASGRLEMVWGDCERVIFLAEGRIVGGQGFGDALAEHGVHGDEDEDLARLMGRAIGAGARPDLVLEAAGQAIGRAVAESVGQTGGMVFFDPQADLPGQAVPLPTAMPVLIAQGLRTARPAARVRAVLGSLLDNTFDAVQDGIGPGGLPSVPLRLWRAAGTPRTLAELVDDDDQAWLAADLLLQLGLARLRLPALAPPVVPTAPSAAPSKRPARPPRSDALNELLAQRKLLRTLDAPGILGITKSADMEPAAIASRFRLLSARFHPDRYARDRTDERRVARDCFAMVNDAFSVLRDDAQRDEARQRLLSQEQGKVYSSASDKRKARLLYTQGEVAFRRRDYEHALSLLERSKALNPEPWNVCFLYSRARFESGQGSAEDCARELLTLQPPPGRAKAEVLYRLGELLLATDRRPAAFKAFTEAVEEYPEHVEAKRRLRLRRLRQEGVSAVRATDREEHVRRAEARAVNEARARRKDKTGGADESGAKKTEGGVTGLLQGLFKRKNR
ncbi:MAG: DnaJ domain-containing protein [Oligoflexia bacterium]|nr:DnaJ domain-containing protein [Oligoflexia bacterium]